MRPTCLRDPVRSAAMVLLGCAARAAARSPRRRADNDHRRSARRHQRQGTSLHRQGRVGRWPATRSCMPTTSGSTSTRIARSRRGNVVFRQGTNQISADRADFDTKTRLGTFYNASGFATAQPPAPDATVPAAHRFRRRSPDRTRSSTSSARPSRRSDRKKYKITSRRLYDVRATDAALGSARRHHRAEHRSLHVAQANGDERQGRAAVLPAGPLLPHEEGGSRDRIPAADLRDVDASRAVDCTTRSSGRSTAARTRPSCTTGLRRRVRAPAPSIGTTSAADRTATPCVHSSTSSRRLRSVAAAQRSYSAERHGESAAAGQVSRRRRASITSPSITTNQTLNTNITTRRAASATSAATSSARGAVLHERHVRSQRILLQPDQLRA